LPLPSSAFFQLESELDALRRSGMHRACPSLAATSASPSRTTVVLDGAHLVSFSSNDYLGLATCPEVLRAAVEATSRAGFGAGSARLMAGNYPEHRALEEQLAEFVQLPAALLFPTGYQANLGALTALAGPDDLVVADRAVHASLIDACRLSRAKLALYPHLDVAAAEKHLRRLGPRARRRILVTESLFSMDGDSPALSDLAELAANHDALFFVDEAHALGTLGPTGRGLCAGLHLRPDVLVGTLGKTLGASGAFVAGSLTLREYLVNRARAFIFTTALPLPVAAAASAALRVARSQEGSRLRAQLRDLVALARTRLKLAPDPIASPIIPIILGDSQLAVDTAALLRSRGFLLPAIRPPTVREGGARLRLSLSALHSQEQISCLCDALDHSLPRPPSQPLAPAASPRSEKPFLPSSRSCGLFLAGTDTSVGKTAVAQGLLHLLTSLGHRPVPFKPVETGAARSPTDAQLLREASQRHDLPPATICPFSFPDPLAPAAAAALAGIHLSLDLLLERAAAAAASGRPILVESAGGILSPYAAGLTSADLAAALAYPVLLVARNALGTVNHTALAVAEIRRRAIPLLGIVLVDTSPIPCPAQTSNSSLIASISGLSPLGVLPFLHEPSPSALASALREHVNLEPLLSSLVL